VGSSPKTTLAWRVGDWASRRQGGCERTKVSNRTRATRRCLRGKSKALSVTMVVTTWTILGESRTPAVTSGRRERAAFSWCLVASRKGRITKDGKAWPPIRLERERSTPRMWGQTLRTVATGVKRCRLLLEDVNLRGPAWVTAVSHSGQGAAGNCAGVTPPQLCCRTQVPVQADTTALTTWKPVAPRALKRARQTRRRKTG
jgi:hypothetical protein